MKLVQILLPLTTSGQSRTGFEQVLQELTEKYGGATAFVNSPAEGLWRDGGVEERDRIVTVEVMVKDFEESWWAEYREGLERALAQKEIVVRALDMMKV